MAASRKLYVDLAASLDSEGQNWDSMTHAHYCATVANTLWLDNRRFDFARFMAACGVEPELYEVHEGFTHKEVRVR